MTYDISIARDVLEVFSESGITSTSKVIDIDSFWTTAATYTVTLTYTSAIDFYKYRMGYKTYR